MLELLHTSLPHHTAAHASMSTSFVASIIMHWSRESRGAGGFLLRLVVLVAVTPTNSLLAGSIEAIIFYILRGALGPAQPKSRITQSEI